MAGGDCAVRQQDRYSVDDGVATGAAEAVYRVSLKLEGLMADWAHEPAQIVCRECSCAHQSILCCPWSGLPWVWAALGLAALGPAALGSG